MSVSTNLAQRLRARIEHEGPISFYEWMKAALYDEREGYYCRADRVPQGRAGDYRTAPEVSSLFAATIADYFSKLHTDLKWPRRWTLVELGAGGGEFAHGLLSHLRAHYPEIFEATRYVIDETAQAARLRAANHLSEFSDRLEFQRFDEIDGPLDPGIIFSNELIDAFPVHRVVMRGGRLRELCVGAGEAGFFWVECDLDPAVAEHCLRIEMQPDEGQIIEVNLDAERFITSAAALLKRGYVVTVDYGAEREDLWGAPDRRSGTLRGYYRHQFVDDVLARPGEHDLTTTIDWTQLQQAGRGAGLYTIRFDRLDQFVGPSVGDFMAQMIREKRDAVEVVRFTTSARELLLPTGLASYFQVLVQEKVV
ncbi:MAG TPA: SAM-dependent methyltransferase [Pyrinomonadaceae bacterium]